VNWQSVLVVGLGCMTGVIIPGIAFGTRLWKDVSGLSQRVTSLESEVHELKVDVKTIATTVARIEGLLQGKFGSS
jgi:maleate cis-trans isomerase